ncbi:MAG: hypothetical protein RI988_320 [Pseudomonadota bacterium]|jgi:RNA polymerase sigma-70 factor (ECF subfamily)
MAEALQGGVASPASAIPPDIEPDDGELVRRVCREGDDAAFAALVRRHQGPLRAWLRRLQPADAQHADDLAQEAFLRAFRKLSSWRGEASFRSWLFRIALSAWQDHQRRPSVWIVPLEDDFARPQTSPLRRDDAAVQDTASDVWTRHMVQTLDVDRALAQLSAVQREVVVHACWADLSHAEIARSLGLPLGTVKTHYRRALALLAHALK